MLIYDYIQTDGYCWFDTGIIPTNDTTVSALITPIQRVGNYSGFFGSQTADANSVGSKQFQLRNDRTSILGNFQERVNGKTTASTTRAVTLNAEYEFELSKAGLSIENTETGEATWHNIGSTTDFQGDYSMYIGGIHIAGGIWQENGTPRAFAAKYGTFRISGSIPTTRLKPAKDDSGVLGFYDEGNQIFHPKLGNGTAIAGNMVQGIAATPERNYFTRTGGTIAIDVECPTTAWTVVADAAWAEITSDASQGKAWVTVSTNSQTTDRTVTLTFTDTASQITATVTLKQDRYFAGIPLIIGDRKVFEPHLGSSALTEAYLGEDLVFTTNFNGLRVSPKEIDFSVIPTGSSVETQTIQIQSSEPWIITATTSAPWLYVDNYAMGTEYNAGTYDLPVCITSAASEGDEATLVFSSATYMEVASISVKKIRLKSIWNGGKAELNFNTSDDLVWIFNGQIIATTASTSLGAYGLEDIADYRFFYHSPSVSYYDVNNNRLVIGNGTTPEIPMNTDIELEGGNFYLKVNGVAKNIGTAQTNVPSALFCINTNSVKVYSLVAKKNGVTIASFTPAFFGYIPALYDSVNNFYVTLPDAQYETLT